MDLPIIRTSNKKGYIDPRNDESNPQAQMINEQVPKPVDYGSPAMSPMPKSPDYQGVPGYVTETQRPNYPEKQAGDYKPLKP